MTLLTRKLEIKRDGGQLYNFAYFYGKGILCPLFIPQCTLVYIHLIRCLTLYSGIVYSLSIWGQTDSLIVVLFPIDIYYISDSPRFLLDSAARAANLPKSYSSYVDMLHIRYTTLPTYPTVFFM